jgi:phosphatidylglycerol---prolipoprotein diacylglyceryl transferase
MRLSRDAALSAPFALSLVAVAVFLGFAATADGVPFFSLARVHVGIPFEPFGAIVVSGVFMGASVLRRHAARYGIGPDVARSLTFWIVFTGAIGAHVFEVLMYERARMDADPWLLLKLWDGISSYGGFLGGAIGYALYVRWKRLGPGVTADTVVIGLLVAFSIGRIGCTVIHDHVGSATAFWMGTDYPRAELARRGLLSAFPGAGELVRAHNLGLYELLFLIPVNALVLSLAFQNRHPLPAGFIAVLVGLLYSPVRFFLEYLRLEVSDPRYAGLTFAQWCSLLAFAASLAAAVALWQHGRPAPHVAKPVGGSNRRARRSRRRSR